MFSVAIVLQIKDLSKFLHYRWKLMDHAKALNHEFSEEDIKKMQTSEKLRAKQEEEEGEKAIGFRRTLMSSRKLSEKEIKYITNDTDEELNESVQNEIEDIIEGEDFKERSPV